MLTYTIIYAYTHAYNMHRIYTGIRSYIHSYIHTHASTDICMQRCLLLYAYTLIIIHSYVIHACIHTYVHGTYKCIQTCTHSININTQVQTYMYVYTHTRHVGLHTA